MEIPREHQHHLSEGPVPDWIVRHPVPPPGRLDGSAAQAALLFDHQFHVENGTYFRRCAYFLPNSLSVQTGSRIEIGFAPDSEHLILHEIVIRRGNEVIAAHAGQELRVLHREAQMERFTFDGRLLAVILLNDVRVGDIVDYSFSHRATREPLFGRIFGRFNLRGEINVEAVRNRLVYQTGRTIYAVPHNWEIPAHAVYTADGLIDSRWDANQVERCEIEPRTPLSAIPHGWIDYGEFATWDEVAEAEARLYPPADEPLPPPMAEWVAQVQAALPSPDQFVTHVLRYVQEDIRYVSVSIDEHTHAPYPVSTILERRFGDCKDKSVLLCRLLGEAGYDATPALVHTADAREVHGGSAAALCFQPRHRAPATPGPNPLARSHPGFARRQTGLDLDTTLRPRLVGSCPGWQAGRGEDPGHLLAPFHHLGRIREDAAAGRER
jgi:hypothetical protein